MTDFLPSSDFVEKTMSRIRFSGKKNKILLKNNCIVILSRYAGAAGLTLFGIVNLIRFLASMYIPVVCH